MNIKADNKLTSEIKNYAMHSLNADLVGIANIERFKNAPLKMSPQGIMPSAKSVVVMAIHHPDAVIELGGLKHPQEIGPYSVQYTMNTRLDDMSYRMGLFIENLGHTSVPIVSSNIWRYNGYKELKEHFAADLSHMHAAVAAGLAEFGYNGLAITPEFGARNRFVTIITDAVLTPSPLVEPGLVCDNCMLCAKNCMSGALKKELDGWNIVEIEDKKYKYVKKNLWRCAWGEHFDLDLDLKIPEKVTEAVIIENVKEHGLRGGEMGSCLRYCLPKNLRYFDKKYTNAPRRKRHFVSNNPDFHRGLLEDIRAIGSRWGADTVLINDEKNLSGIELGKYLPDAKTAISVVLHYKKIELDLPDGANPYSTKTSGSWFILEQSAYDICRLLERFGYSSVTRTEFPEKTLESQITNVAADREIATLTVLTDVAIPVTGTALPDIDGKHCASGSELRKNIQKLVSRHEGDAVGVSSASRIEKMSAELAKFYDGDEMFKVKDNAKRFYAFEPEITKVVRKVLSPKDYLKGAKSVIVLGLRIPKGTTDTNARTPAEAVGPYAFAQFESVVRLRFLAWNVMRFLEDEGHSAAIAFDLTGTSSVSGTPRGEQPDAFTNNFTAVAAGLGRLGKCGTVITPENGTNMRFVAVITDADLPEDNVSKDASLNESCAKCTSCISSCPTKAFGAEISIKIDGVVEKVMKIDQTKCDWAKRYSLVAGEGNQYLGWKLDIPVPDKITPDKLDAALRQQPPIPKYRPCNFENCVMACPHTRKQD